MKTLNNEPHLTAFLDSKRIKYEVIQDGWAIRLITELTTDEIFKLGGLFATYQKNKVEA